MLNELDEDPKVTNLDSYGSEHGIHRHVNITIIKKIIKYDGFILKPMSSDFCAALDIKAIGFQGLRKRVTDIEQACK
jgi:hypothetical protein